jgi:hypothetical protein
MKFNAITTRAVSALPYIGIALALANWEAKPNRVWIWAPAIVMFVIMALARRRSAESIPPIPVFVPFDRGPALGALMYVIPLAVELAHVYGIVDDPNSGLRTLMVIFGADIAAIGNTLPRLLPPVSSTPYGGARAQASQRFIGWTWVLCGLGFAASWLALPVGGAQMASSMILAFAILLTSVQRLRVLACQRR